MWTKTKLVSKLPILIAAVVLISGCTGEKCETDSDCGQDYCSNNMQTITSIACVEGRCAEISTECPDSEICVQDSLGVRCLPKDPDTSKPVLSCGENTDTIDLVDNNPFNPDIFICRDDCPANTYCSDSCYCEEKVEISCIGNTDDRDVNGDNLFDQRIEMCADDCPGGHDCNSQCICEMRPRPQCPDPEFNNSYFGDAPAIDYDFETLLKMWSEDPYSLLDLEPIINITAYTHHRNGTFHDFPFPEFQLELVPNPDNEYLLQYGAYCVNDYYEAVQALDIKLQWFNRPEQTCIWGVREGFEGTLTVCPEDVMNWFDTYSANIGLWLR